jgi:hypothetical protein
MFLLVSRDTFRVIIDAQRLNDAEVGQIENAYRGISLIGDEGLTLCKRNAIGSRADFCGGKGLPRLKIQHRQISAQDVCHVGASADFVDRDAERMIADRHDIKPSERRCIYERYRVAVSIRCQNQSAVRRDRDDMDIDGKKVKALTHFDRNGFAYVLDRTNGTLLRANKFVTVDWAEKVDLKTGRPIKVREHSPFEIGRNTPACPSAMGGKDEWDKYRSDFLVDAATEMIIC